VRGGHAAVALDVATQAEPIGHVIEVAFRLGLAREVLLPVPLVQQFLGERVAIGPAFRIEACARITIPVSGAANIRASLEYKGAETELAQLIQLIQLIQARDTGADNKSLVFLDFTTRHWC
jgi:hypothetical protein